MTFNNGIYIQFEITKRTRFLFVLSSIQRNTKSHDKKENEERNVRKQRDKISYEKRREKEPRIRILKRIMNIFGR